MEVLRTMDLENELSKLAEQDLNNVLTNMLHKGKLSQEQFTDLMREDRDVKEVVAYLGYLDAKKEANKLNSLSKVSRKVVASVKKDLERVKRKGSRKIPKISTHQGFIETMKNMVGEDKQQAELNKAFED